MTDLEALAAYDSRRDADAFRQIVLAYQGMVYSVCLRALGNSADAEDAAQETFLKLAQAAGRVRKNPASWLYSCALHTAHDKRRSEQTRQARERDWAQMHAIENADDWRQIMPAIDTSIAELPDDERELLLQYYFAGRTQADLAQQAGISQPAMKKRLDHAVDALRTRLHRMGYVVSAGVLAACMANSAAEAAVPPALTAALCKIGLAGVGQGIGAATAATAAPAFLATLAGKLAIGVAAAIIAVAAVVAIKHTSQPPKGQTDVQAAGIAWDGKNLWALDNAQKRICIIEKTGEKQMAIVRRDGNKVWIEGTPPPVTKGYSYARGLSAVLNFLGTPADYDTIMGDSGRAFILQAEDGGPIIDGNVDVGWWPMGAWGIKMRLEFVSHCVGRQIRVIDGDDNAYRADPLAHYRQRFQGELLASIDNGRPVLAEHDMCFVVTGYDDGNPPLLGDWALSDKPAFGRIPDHPWGMIVFGAEQQRLDRKTADVQAIRHAVALIHDEPQVTVPMFFKEWQGVRARYTGQESFALWAAALRDVQHLGQARYHANMSLHLGINRRSAVAFLKAMAARHPGEPGGHLTAAANLYDQELVLLATADTGQAAMTSRDGREKLAQLAEQMAAIEARAGDELEKALMAWQPKSVRRDDNRVWIDGVPSVGWDKHQCTYAGALEAAMAVTQRPVSYTHIMGTTGLAFRTRWFQGRVGQKWCPSSPVGEFPEEIEATQKATGWPMNVICVPDNPKMERFTKDIIDSIDAGRPVPAYEPGLNVDVIYGYKDGGITVLLKDYFKGDIELPVDKLGWMLFFLRDPVEPLSKREAFLQGLRIAVKNWQREPWPSEKGEYLYGGAALARWAEDLGKLDGLNQGDKGNLQFVSNWCFSSMWDARAAAASFLEQNVNELGGDAKPAIQRALELYRRESNLLKDVVTGNQPDARRREFLGEARKLEAAAIAELKAALATLDQ